MIDLPHTQAEKELELYILKEVMKRVKDGMPMQEIITVLKRVRHITTEIALEILND